MWAARRRIIGYSPKPLCTDIEPAFYGVIFQSVSEIGKSSTSEIRHGRTLAIMPAPFGAILEVLALTGQGREEVAQMAWSEIDEATRTWHIPSQRAKNAKAHLVHLFDRVWEIIKSRPQHSHFVFATSGGKNFQSFKFAKANLDQLSGVTWMVLHR
jgi:integrase